MRPYVVSICERASGLPQADVGWRRFFQRLDNGLIDDMLVPPTARAYEIARQMALNHINRDLRASLTKNGVGKNAVWRCIGDEVDKCQKRITGGLAAGAEAVGFVLQEFNVQAIRDEMRESVKECDDCGERDGD